MAVVGRAYRGWLPPGHADALEGAIDVLTDQLMGEYARMEAAHKRRSLDDEWTLMGSYLPPEPFPGAYGVGFVRRFIICFLIVGWKLAQPRHMRLSCVAEELALWMIVRHAEADLDARGVTPDFSTFEDCAFEDEDFRWLYTEEGRELLANPQWVDQMRVVNLDFRSWFEPFREQHEPPHPYVRDWSEHARRHEREAAAEQLRAIRALKTTED